MLPRKYEVAIEKATASDRGTNKAPRGALHAERGQKHGDDTKHREQPGHDHLEARVEHMALEARSRARDQMRMNVLDDDRGLVDQNAHRQGQAAQGHDVDASAR